MIRAHPMTSFAAVLSLTLGIGLNAAVFSTVYTVLYRPLQLPTADRLVYLTRETSGDADAAQRLWSLPSFDAIEDAAGRELAGIAAVGDRTIVLRSGDHSIRARVQFVTDDFFRLVGVAPGRGRLLDGNIDAADGNAVVISDGLWRARLNAEERVLGATLLVNDVPSTVVGVASPGFSGLDGQVDLWMSTRSAPAVLHSPEVNGDRYWAYTILGLLERGSDARGMQPVLRTVERRLGPTSDRLRIERVQDAMIPPAVRRGLLLLLAAGALVMFAACANAGISVLAMFEARRREFALRSALGATVRRMVRQIALETSVLITTGVLAGIVVALAAQRVIWAMRPASGLGSHGSVLAGDGPYAFLPVVGYALCAAAVGILVVGLWPAFSLWLNERRLRLTVFSEGSLYQQSARHARGMNRLLSVGQIALAFMLATTTTTLVRSFLSMQRWGTELASPDVVVAQMALPTWRYDAGLAARTYSEVHARLRAIPGVEAVMLDATVPFTYPRPTTAATVNRALPDGRGGRGTLVSYRALAGDHLAILGSRLLDGRAFDRGGEAEGAPVALVNRAAAELYWPGVRAVGQQLPEVLRTGIDPAWRSLEVVGVVENVGDLPPGQAPIPEIYVPIAQDPPPRSQLFVRSRSPGVAAAVQSAVREIDAGIVVDGVTTFADVHRRALSSHRFSAILLSVASAVTLILASVGTFAANLADARQREQEIAVRAALGATGLRTVRNVLGAACRDTALGLSIGVALSLMLSGVVQHYLGGADATMFSDFAVAATMLAGITLIAALLPIYRMSRTSPMLVLRG